MCDFGVTAAVISAASIAASSYVAYQSQQQAAGAAEKQANKLSRLEVNRSGLEAMQLQQMRSEQQQAQLLNMQYMMDDATRSLSNTNEQFNRQVASMNTEYTKVHKAAAGEASTALVRASEGGVGGISVSALLADYALQEYNARVVLDTDKGNLLQDYERQATGVKTQLDRAQQAFTMQTNFDSGQLQRQLASSGLESSYRLAQINDPSKMAQRPNQFASFLAASAGVAGAANEVDYKSLGSAIKQGQTPRAPRATLA